MAVGRLFKLGKCAKKDFFGIMIKALKDVGWADISSKPDTDYWVMVSEGESKNKNLVIQFRDWHENGTSTQDTRSVQTTDYNSFSVRFPLEYQPGSSGTAGIFGRPATTYDHISLYHSAATPWTQDKNMMIEYAIAVNKDSIAFVITPPLATLTNSLAYFIGLPDESYTEERNSDGLIFASSYTSGNNNTAGIVAVNKISIANQTSEQYMISANTTTRDVKSSVAIKNPNSAGLYVLTDMTYENASEGTRGKINSFLFLPNMNILANDIILDGDHKYRISLTQGTNTSFPSTAIAYRIE